MGETKYSYSLNEEIYHGQHLTEEDAALAGFAKDPSADAVWVGLNVERTPTDFVSVGDIIENLQCAAGDECGEASEDWLDDLDKDKAKKAELRDLIGGWLDQNYPVKFWTVEDAKQFQRSDVLFGGGDD